MRYWWVNQSQTFNQESSGGYLWSPKHDKNYARNQTYENMREVAPGDIVFSYRDTTIAAIGVATSCCYQSAKPPEFGEVGPNWNNIGWKVNISYMLVPRVIRPRDFFSLIEPHLPTKYSPLQPRTRRGNMKFYLVALSVELGEILLRRILEMDVEDIVSDASFLQKRAEDRVREETAEWEQKIESDIRNGNLGATEKDSIIRARRGQGIYRRNVFRHEARCRITGVSNPDYLIASHIKPWRDCADGKERLDGENGLLLTPTMDHLFDRGLISVGRGGELWISPCADIDAINRVGLSQISGKTIGQFSRKQSTYLEYHRDEVYLKARPPKMK
jgi:hypothetical protein